MTFPLVPRGRMIGLSYGTMRSLRRGSGTDVAGSRPYQVGDDVHAIDWGASARLSAARSSDEFVVRERFAEEAPRVVIVCDRRPELSFYEPPLPWLDKAAAMQATAELILESALLVGGFVGYLDHGSRGEPYWVPPRGGRRLWDLREERLPSREFDGPRDSLARAFAHLAEHRRSVTSGAFVFALSDFLPLPHEDFWLTALEHRWDVVPVVIQDPTWEQSFPAAAGVVLPLRDPRTGRRVHVRLTKREAAARREANEQRLLALLAGFEAAGLDAVVVSSSDPGDILGGFLAWSDLRRLRRAA
ncbi:MAG: DUF58 domain-containing protein [Gaiellaceae bacterium]